MKKPLFRSKEVDASAASIGAGSRERAWQFSIFLTHSAGSKLLAGKRQAELGQAQGHVSLQRAVDRQLKVRPS